MLLFILKGLNGFNKNFQVSQVSKLQIQDISFPTFVILLFYSKTMLSYNT